MLDEIQEPVRRADRARAALAVLGVVILVGAVTAGAVLAGHHGDPGTSSAHVADQPSASPAATPTGKPPAEAPNPDCGHGADLIDIFTAAPPPIADLARQKALIEELEAKSWSAFEIADAEPTQLGVVALVSGSYQAAKETLLAEGVRQVAVQAKELGSAHDQAMNFIQELIEPAIDDITRLSKDVPGYTSIAVWSEGGAVVVDWKAPIPAEVQALAGVRKDGVNVIIQPVRYSSVEISAALDRVSKALRVHRVDAEWSSSSACQDGSGIVVGIQPDSLGSRKAALESQLSEIAEMPAHVVAEEAIVPL